ncbi:CACTA en-spm transposon protein [Cucumis melo var. makuwa]|uniref:CACTA en-spm transposon protein n=1 Tax=Cucumis melo var. makuwa TaxID=1194695 RepID=A0A5A7UQU0_CUCMM|nr:CACTA en-spm transposon protein [Cucumis melo var. makuwa]TYK24063.1 CACTA en-spm transposon protein [Cucumis melo var. makuwa]
MLSMWKGFRRQNHCHFKKFEDPERLPHSTILGDLEQSSMNMAVRVRQPYNHNSDAKSFLQRQHELVEHWGHPIDCVKLLKETHAPSGQFVSQVAADAHGSQPLSGDEICETVLDKQSGYSKGLG